MAGSLNRACLLGNVGKDPEIRSTQSGDRIANISIATEESWTDKTSGDKKSRTEWHRIVIFNPGLVGVVEKYVKKGSKLYVEGQITTRKWTDQQGVEKYSTEIVLQKFGGTLLLLGDKGGASDAPAEQRQEQRRTEQSGGGAPRGGSSWDAPSGGDLDDSIPF